MEKIVVGDLKGLVNRYEPFNIDNNTFAALINAYGWRKKVLRKRGTEKIGRLTRNLTDVSLTAAPGSGTTYTENIKTTLSFNTTQPNSEIIPGSITITVGSLLTVTDDGDGTFTQTGGSGTLDSSAAAVPVMG